MKRLLFSLVLSLCLSASVAAGEIDGTGKTPPPPPPACTENCTTSTQQTPTEDDPLLLMFEILAGTLVAR